MDPQIIEQKIVKIRAENHDFMLLAACLLEDRLPNSTDMIVMKSPRLPPQRDFESMKHKSSTLSYYGEQEMCNVGQKVMKFADLILRLSQTATAVLS